VLYWPVSERGLKPKKDVSTNHALLREVLSG
jgi:hypothetical protein